ncbi:hypothetical protein ACWED2_17570 [Amycolatopsis sp. NPDC005003]
MRTTKIGSAAAAALCVGGLAVAAPQAAAAPPTPAASVAAPPAHCLSGVRRVQVTCLHTPFRRLYVVQSVWMPYTTSPCLKSG